MKQRIDADVLAGFIEEVNLYLPELRATVAHLQAREATPELLEEARRMTHIIKGASAMVGLTVLSRMAHLLEEFFHEPLAEMQDIPSERWGYLVNGLENIQSFVDMLIDDYVGEEADVQQMATCMGQLRGTIAPRPWKCQSFPTPSRPRFLIRWRSTIGM